MNKLKVPQLRFPGFEGEWKNSELNKFASLNPKNSSLPESFVYIDLESVTDGHLIKENIILKNEAPSRAQRVLKEMDILYQTVRPYQKNNLFFNKVGHYVASTGYAQIRTKNDSQFLFQFLHTEKFVANVMLRCTGTGYPAINSTDLSSIEISFPSIPEQQKIASFLSAVDEKIQQLSRKKELLEQYKKGVMQQLFSGKLRFKDEKGNEYPDWEEKKLGDVSVFLDGRRKPIKSQDRTKMKGTYPYYGASGIIDYVNSYIFDEEIILLGEDGENIVSRNLPLAFRVSGKCWVNNHAHVIKPINNNDIDFLTYSLERINYVIYNTGTAQPKLNQEVCRNIPLSIPSLPEQQKIANFLSSIDAKIENTKDELEKTQLFKKGLLQKMFA